MVAFYHSTREAEDGKPISWRTAWSTNEFQDSQGFVRETRRKKERGRRREGRKKKGRKIEKEGRKKSPGLKR